MQENTQVEGGKRRKPKEPEWVSGRKHLFM